MITQKKLDAVSGRQIYEWHLVNHFPPDEVKPFYIMEAAMEAGNYEIYGYFEEDRLLGYTFLMRAGDYLLLDYFAVLEEMRRLGKGSEILAILKAQLREKETMFIEAEAPDPDEPEIRAVQLRRIQFYLRNGAKGAGMTGKAFGVPYRILTLGRSLYGARARTGMETLYRSLLPPEMYEEAVEFSLDIEKR